MLTKALLLLAVASSQLMAYVSWDGYIFRIEGGTATLKHGADLLFVCDRSDVKVVDNRLIVDDYDGQRVEIEISSATASAIANEFRRDREGTNRRRDDYRRDPPVCPPPVRPTPRPEPEGPKEISAPASQSY